SVRTHAFSRAAARIDDVPADVVVVSRIADLYRASGAIYGHRRWLTAAHAADLAPAVGLAASAGARRVDVVDLDRHGVAPTFPGWRQTGLRHVGLQGFSLV